MSPHTIKIFIDQVRLADRKISVFYDSPNKVIQHYVCPAKINSLSLVITCNQDVYISRHIVGLWTLLPARVAPTLKKVAEMTRYCLFSCPGQLNR